MQESKYLKTILLYLVTLHNNEIRGEWITGSQISFVCSQLVCFPSFNISGGLTKPMDSIFPVGKLITHKSILTSDPTQYDVGFLLFSPHFRQCC